jgi:fructose-bisphosphate aldolase class I
MDTAQRMSRTIDQLVMPGRGILAADESLPTIAKRFAAIEVPSTEENRRAYRSLLCGTPGLGDYISGVILFEETLTQRNGDGEALPKVLERAGIVPGIKVDKGTVRLPASADWKSGDADWKSGEADKVSEGVDGLAARLEKYVEAGARFAKFRSTFVVDATRPSRRAMEANAVVQARYAAICQDAGVVPIVEPEVLMDGAHSLERCAEVTEAVQHAVFDALYRYGVVFEHMVLKPNMVIPGKDAAKATSADIAAATLAVLKRTVPAAVPSVNFLSCGQTAEEATENLRAINAAAGNAPWLLSFSYGRALQQPVLQAWRGLADNVRQAQAALLERARANGTLVRAVRPG